MTKTKIVTSYNTESKTENLMPIQSVVKSAELTNNLPQAKHFHAQIKQLQPAIVS